MSDVPPQIETRDLEILCWFNWYDGPVSGLMLWQDKLFWYDFAGRWGWEEDEHKQDALGDDWGYIYDVFPLTETQRLEAVTWFKEKQDWFENKRFQNEGIKLRDWEGPKPLGPSIAQFSDKEGLNGGGHKDYGLAADFKIPTA